MIISSGLMRMMSFQEVEEFLTNRSIYQSGGEHEQEHEHEHKHEHEHEPQSCMHLQSLPVPLSPAVLLKISVKYLQKLVLFHELPH